MSSEDTNKCPFYSPRFPESLRDIDHDNIDGNSDLVVWAPIKEGFVDAFGNITYESRLRIVAEALNKLRKNVREFQLFEPFPDSTKRILSLLAFRIGVVDRDLFGYGREMEADGDTLRPRQYMYLTATFDGPWEPYMRQIWWPLGPFLDLVLCNCDGYPLASKTGFEDYIKWVREHSMDTAMFYSVSNLSVKDNFYLREVERTQRENSDLQEADELISMLYTQTPEYEALKEANKDVLETLTLALEGLNVLYQLTRYYPPDTTRDGQGDLLIAAAEDILQRKTSDDFFNPVVKAFSKARPPVKKKIKELIQQLKLNYKDQLDWLNHNAVSVKPRIEKDPPVFDDGEVQKGLLTTYDDDPENPMTVGAMLLFKITDPDRAKYFLDPELWSWEGAQSSIFRNVSFTYGGLKKLSLSEQELSAFPKEFRQGAEERAPMLGDMHHNHPQRWKLPKRWAHLKPIEGLPPVHLSEVDIIVQLRVSDSRSPLIPEEVFVDFNTPEFKDFDGTSPKTKPHHSSSASRTTPSAVVKEILELISSDFAGVEKIKGYINILSPGDGLGIELLSVESAYRPGVITGSIANIPIVPTADDGQFVAEDNISELGVPTSTLNLGPNITRDHFGFRDGISQPEPVHNLDFVEPKASHPMQVRRGDIIIGSPNMLGDSYSHNPNKQIQKNGSFLAIRKMKQNVGEFERFLQDSSHKLPREQIAAKIMGRTFDGDVLLPNVTDNNFRYSENEAQPKTKTADDEFGLLCPFASHIRRTNPRDIIHGRKTPKILRRGMSYGAHVRFDERAEGDFDKWDEVERGVLFMAYCANLSEQYETILRWINGGNSTNIGSGQNDPIIAALPKTGRSVVRFPAGHYTYNEDGKIVGKSVDQVVRLEKRTESIQKTPPRPFVQLEWSEYAFVPSKTALKTIIENISRPKVKDASHENVVRGRHIFEEIDRLPTDTLKRRQLKILLEDHLTKDPSKHKISTDVWHYINQERGGIVRLKSGVEGRGFDDAQAVVLVTSPDLIKQVLSNPSEFSACEIGTRISSLFDRNQIGMDPEGHPNGEYERESEGTNKILYNYSSEKAFVEAYKEAKQILGAKKAFTKAVGKTKFKLEIVSEFLAPTLGGLCDTWFGIRGSGKDHVFDTLGWGWKENRKPRCPGDFFAVSRGAFYPRPTPAIYDYAQRHGQHLKKGSSALLNIWNKRGFTGYVTKQIKAEIDSDPRFKSKSEKDDLLRRNIIGAMIGMLPPTEANLRAVLFDWFDETVFWSLQGQLVSAKLKTGKENVTYSVAKSILFDDMLKSMIKRPAPDLLHRTVVKAGRLGHQNYMEGDLFIVSSVAAMREATLEGLPGKRSAKKVIMDTTFGGGRGKSDPTGASNRGGNPHACPAQGMAIGSMLGILTALFEAGRIQQMPASLILEISDW